MREATGRYGVEGRDENVLPRRQQEELDESVKGPHAVLAADISRR